MEIFSFRVRIVLASGGGINYKNRFGFPSTRLILFINSQEKKGKSFVLSSNIIHLCYRVLT